MEMRFVMMAVRESTLSLDAMMDRRRLLQFGVAGSIALLTESAVRTLRASAAEAEYRTITSLNLRAKASATAKVLLVMPAGAIVSDQGYAKNGFIKVGYQGTVGWASAAYLGPVDPAYDPTMTGSGVTIASANLRGGPSSGDDLLATVPTGSTVETSDSIIDGYRYVTFDGTPGWLLDSKIGEAAGIQTGDTLTVTSAVNLRKQPSISAAVLAVLPAGSQVTAKSQTSNGFRAVAAAEKTGWVYESYLA
jgi:N-acetylmuramoyl-L-alanine amidase